jgi:hypothetical protein
MAGDPGAPDVRGVGQAALDLLAGGDREDRLGGGDHGQNRGRACRGGERAERPTARELGVACVERTKRHLQLAVPADKRVLGVLEIGRVPPVVEARLEPPVHRHRARPGLDLPHQLTPRGRLTRVHRQGVGEGHRAAVGVEGGLEHVGPLEVAALGLERDRRCHHEMTAAGRVQQGAEDARGVQLGQAQPIDGAVHADQRERAAIADGRVVLDR